MHPVRAIRLPVVGALVLALSIWPSAAARSQAGPGDPGSGCPQIGDPGTRDFLPDLIPLGVVIPGGGSLRPGCGQDHVLRGYRPGSLDPYCIPLGLPPCFSGPCAGQSGFASAALYCLTLSGYCCPLRPGDRVPADTRRTVPIIAALGDRFYDDRDNRQFLCWGRYRGNGPRLIRVALVSEPPAPGTSEVMVFGFVTLFLHDAPGADATGALVPFEVVEARLVPRGPIR